MILKDLFWELFDDIAHEDSKFGKQLDRLGIAENMLSETEKGKAMLAQDERAIFEAFKPAVMELISGWLRERGVDPEKEITC